MSNIFNTKYISIINKKINFPKNENKKLHLKNSIRDALWPYGNKVELIQKDDTNFMALCRNIQIDFIHQNKGTKISICLASKKFITAYTIILSTILIIIWTLIWGHLISMKYTILNDDNSSNVLFSGWAIIIFISFIISVIIKTIFFLNLKKKINNYGLKIINNLENKKSKKSLDKKKDRSLTNIKVNFSPNNISFSGKINNSIKFNNSNFHNFFYSICEKIFKKHGKIKNIDNRLHWISNDINKLDLNISTSNKNAFIDLEFDSIINPFTLIFIIIYLWFTLPLWINLIILIINLNRGFELLGFIGSFIKNWGGIFKFWIIPPVIIFLMLFITGLNRIVYYKQIILKIISSIEKYPEKIFNNKDQEFNLDFLNNFIKGFSSESIIYTYNIKLNCKIKNTLKQPELNKINKNIKDLTNTDNELTKIGYSLFYDLDQKTNIFFTPIKNGTELSFRYDMEGLLHRLILKFSLALSVIWSILFFIYLPSINNFPFFINNNMDKGNIFYFGLSICSLIGFISGYFIYILKKNNQKLNIKNIIIKKMKIK